MEKLLEILNYNKNFLDLPNKTKILCLGNLTLIPYEDMLVYHLRQLGLECEIKSGLYNSIIPEMLKYTNEYDAIVLNYDPFSLLLKDNFRLKNINGEEIRSVEKNYKQLIELVIKTLNPSKKLLIVSIPKPFLDDTFELQSEIIQVVHNLNNYLESIRGRDLQILDISKFINLIGSQVAYKETYVQMDTSPYTLEFVRYFSQLSACVLIKQLLPYKKILILDCDETLWGGITAEVGPLDITLDTISQSGIFFHKLQKIFSEFREKGVILGMCSKNNFESIKSTFTINDYMVLSLEDFVAIKVNWKPKSINILDICSELNILSDSVVFIDDSLFELNEVISGQHKITCIQTPTTDFEIELLKWKLQILFSNISITSEDQKRTQYYQHKTLRDNQVNNYTTYDDYLKSLNTCVKLTKCSDQTNIERIVQLSQKTNQFNFMYSRFDRNDIIRILRQNDYTIYTGEVKDNVGDSGIVFLLVTREINLNPKKIEIIELTLSCRVFGRNVAEKSVIFIMEHLKNIGVEKILCGFNESNKNLQFKDFLPNLKFKLVTSSAHNFGFEFDLKNTQITQLDYPNVKADF